MGLRASCATDSGAARERGDAAAMSATEDGLQSDLYWHSLERLWERATGGSNVAAAPGGVVDYFWPEGPSAPAADEVVDWIVESVEANAPGALVFLVGGPGNGKSALASRVDRKLSRVSSHTAGLAHRAYRYQGASGGRLTVVNDATIPPAGGGAGLPATPLIDEIDSVLDEGCFLLANINRGVLYEELGAKESESPGSHVVKWLSDPEGESATVAGMEQTHNFNFLHVMKWINPSGADTTVVAVYMDVCSLCEVRPTVHVESAQPLALAVGGYEVARFSDRGVSEAFSTSAGQLLHEFTARLDQSHDAEAIVDPVWANIESLRSPALQRSVVSVLRAAELATAKRFTYRELWGAYCRLVVGDLPQRETHGNVRQWLSLNQPGGARKAELFAGVASLAGLRFHQSLFGARPFSLRGSGARENSAVDPVLALTGLVDPARDAKPGRYPSPTGGWADPVLSAIGSRSDGDSPLDYLLRACEHDSAFQEAVTSFDRALNQSYVDATEDQRTSDAERRRMDSWYGEYLLRLYGTAVGRPAFFSEIDLWTLAWRMAPTSIPTELRGALRTLLQPRRDPDVPSSSFVLPLYDARAIPITGSPEDPRLGFVAPDVWSLKTRSKGDSLEVRLAMGDEVIESLQLDFPLLREAMACSEGHLGITEFSQTASPRLERFRASMLRPSSDGEYVVVLGPDEYQLSLLGEG